MMRQILYISQLGEPERYRTKDFWGCPGGDDDAFWLDYVLQRFNLHMTITPIVMRLHEGDQLPDPSTYDAVIIGGAVHGPCETHPWAADLHAWLQHYRMLSRPLYASGRGAVHVHLALGGTYTFDTSEQAVGSLEVTPAHPDDNIFFNPKTVGTDYRFHVVMPERISNPGHNAVPLAYIGTQPVAWLIDDRWVTTIFQPDIIPEALPGWCQDDWNALHHRFSMLPYANLWFVHALETLGILNHPDHPEQKVP